MIDLTILICSTNTRWKTFGRAIQDQVWPQYDALSPEDQERVEILMVTDNKKLMLGDKRNVMVDIAQGQYVVFVDDDDRIAPDYIQTLLDATGTGVDVITFKASVSLNGQKPRPCIYSLKWGEDSNTATEYRRLPNHICCIRRDKARSVSYPSVLYGEDRGYAKLLAPHLSTEHHIDRELYFYDYSDATTETQTHVSTVIRKRKQDAIVDVVMLSKASTPKLREMTQKAVNTCLAGANSLPVNVIVIEQIAEVRYDNAETIYHPAEFNYNAFCNMGAREGKAPWVVFANNDLLFSNNWLHALLEANHPVVSPKCPRDGRQVNIKRNTTGDRTGRHLSGWCFMMTRALWEEIGGLDEDFAFWCADDSLIEQVKAKGVLPMLVPSSKVEHLWSQTGGTDHGDGSRTWAMIEKFSTKYHPHRLTTNEDYKKWLKAKSG